MDRERPIERVGDSARGTRTDDREAGVTAGPAFGTRAELLASEGRRTTLAILSERDPPVALRDLATAVVERETGAGGPAPARVREAEIALHHVHLPKLAEAGVVDYDPDRNVVEDLRPDSLPLPA